MEEPDFLVKLAMVKPFRRVIAVGDSQLVQSLLESKIVVDEHFSFIPSLIESCGEGDLIITLNNPIECACQVVNYTTSDRNSRYYIPYEEQAQVQEYIQGSTTYLEQYRLHDRMRIIIPNPSLNLTKNDYEFISVGDRCFSSIMLKDFNLRLSSYPFDYIPSSPSLILKYCQTASSFYPSEGSIYNEDGIPFAHFLPRLSRRDFRETFEKRLGRFQNVLTNAKPVVFVHTTESQICPLLKSQDDYQEGLLNLIEHIERHKSGPFLFLSFGHQTVTHKHLINVLVSMDNKVNKLTRDEEFRPIYKREVYKCFERLLQNIFV